MKKIISTLLIIIMYCFLSVLLSTFPPTEALSQEFKNTPVITSEEPNTTLVDSLVKVADEKLDNVSKQTRKNKELAKTAERESRKIPKTKIRIVVKKEKIPIEGQILSDVLDSNKKVLTISDTTYTKLNSSKTKKDKNWFQRIFSPNKNKSK